MAATSIAVLIVEDDPFFGAALLLPINVHQLHARTAEEGRTLVSESLNIRLVLVDAALQGSPDAGVQLLEAIAHMRPSLAIALMSTADDPKIVNRAAAMGVPFLKKPFLKQHLTTLLSRARANSNLPTQLALHLEASCRKWRLSPQQRLIVEKRVAGQNYLQIAVELRISRNTLRNYIREALAKSGFHSLDDLALTIAREAFKVT